MRALSFLLVFLIAGCSQPKEPENSIKVSGPSARAIEAEANAEFEAQTKNETAIELVCRMGGKEDELSAIYLVKGQTVLEKLVGNNVEEYWQDVCNVPYIEKVESCLVSVGSSAINIETEVTQSSEGSKLNTKISIDRVTGRFRQDRTWENGSTRWHTGRCMKAENRAF